MARLTKRSLNLSGHATSLALEPEFWAVLDAMAKGQSFAALIGAIDAKRGESPLASACRVAVLKWVQDSATVRRGAADAAGGVDDYGAVSGNPCPSIGSE